MLLATSQIEASSLHALIPRIPEMQEINGALTPFSRRRVSTCQPHGSHQADVPRVAQTLATRELETSTVETDSPQPLRPRYAIWRGLDSMVAPTSRYSGLRDSKGLVFHIQSHESPIRDVSRRQIPRLSFLFDQRPRSHRDLVTWDFMTPRVRSSTSKTRESPIHEMVRSLPPVLQHGQSRCLRDF